MPIDQVAWGPKPQPDQRVWRYLNYAKFLHLVHAKALYLTRLGRMGDRYEGHLPRITVEQWGDEVDSTPGNAMPGAMIPGATPEWGRHHLGEEAQRRARELFINCWHMNDVESEAMWVMYGGRGASLAIDSTVARVQRAIDTTEQVQFGTVRYIRFDSEHVPDHFYAPVFHKRKSYEHERELRLVIHDAEATTTQADHKLLPVSLTQLIQSVRLAPSTPPNMVETVRALLEKYGLHVPVSQSILDKTPDYT